MDKVIYRVVPHDGGWAYRVDDVYSETFPTHAEALAAALRAAAEQEEEGSTEVIEYEDAEGRWHEEIAPGDDRPVAVVEDPVAVVEDPVEGRQTNP
jgi:hypothetical protein